MNLNNEKGAILITIIVFIAICTLVLGTGLAFIQNGNKRFQNTARKNQALYLAEAGVDYIVQKIYDNPDVESAINYLKNSPEYIDSFELENGLKGRFTAKIWKDDISDGSKLIELGPTEELIISTGEVISLKNGIPKVVPFGKKTINCKIIRPYIPGPLFEKALAAKEDLTIGGELIEGDSQAGQDSSNTVNVETTIHGDIIAAGNVIIKKNVSIVGEVDEGNPNNKVIIPALDPLDLNNWRNQNWEKYNNIINSDLSITSDYTFNFTYIDGGLNISGNGTITLENNPVIYVKNDITISGTVKIKGTGIFIIEEGNNPKDNKNVALSITGNVDNYDTNDKKPKVGFINLGTGSTKVSGNSSVSGVIFSPNGDIDISGNSHIYGSAIGNNLVTSGSSQVTYQIPEVPYGPIIVLGPIQINQWVERFE